MSQPYSHIKFREIEGTVRFFEKVKKVDVHTTENQVTNQYGGPTTTIEHIHTHKMQVATIGIQSDNGNYDRFKTVNLRIKDLTDKRIRLILRVEGDYDRDVFAVIDPEGKEIHFVEDGSLLERFKESMRKLLYFIPIAAGLLYFLFASPHNFLTFVEGGLVGVCTVVLVRLYIRIKKHMMVREIQDYFTPSDYTRVSRVRYW